MAEEGGGMGGRRRLNGGEVEGEGGSLPASCFPPQCGLCGDTLVVMGASVSMQISLPSVCSEAQQSVFLCAFSSGAVWSKRPAPHQRRSNTHI